MIAVLSVLVLPARAQPIPFGMHVIPVYNYIENSEDFPDYRFISASLSFLSDEMHAIGFVTGDGLIRTVYPRFCTNSVYAVPKVAIDISDAFILEMNGTEFTDFLESSGAKMVRLGLSHFGFVSDWSTKMSVTRYYYIDFEWSARLTRTVVTHGLRDIHIVLIVLPIVGLAGVVAILAKRKRKCTR